MIIGIDVGGTTIDAVVVPGHGGPVLAQRSRPTPADGGNDLIAALTETVDDLRDCIAGRPLQAVGIAVPGLVDCARGTVAHAVNLGIGATPLTLSDRLATAVGVPVVLDNDARAGAMAALDLLRRTRPDASDVAYLNLGTGLSLGLVLGGRPHRGPLGHAGEIGHVPMPGSDARCGCGLRGCLEARIAGPAIARRWPDDGGQSTRALFCAAADGDVAARDLADAVTEDVALLVHLVINLTGIGDVVIGGGVAVAHPDLLDGVRQHLAATRRRSPLAAAALDPDRVRAAPSDATFAALGAVAIAFQALDPASPRRPGRPAPLFPPTARVIDTAPPRHDASQAGAGVHQGERR